MFWVIFGTASFTALVVSWFMVYVTAKAEQGKENITYHTCKAEDSKEEMGFRSYKNDRNIGMGATKTK